MRPSAISASTNQCCPPNGTGRTMSTTSSERFFPFPQQQQQAAEQTEPGPQTHHQLSIPHSLNPHQKPSRRLRIFCPRRPSTQSTTAAHHKKPRTRHNGHVARAPHAPLAGLANGLSPLREHRHQQSRRGYQGSRLQGPGWPFTRRRRCWWCCARPRPDIEQDWRPNRARDCFY